jgi:hypothetical protein
MRFRQTKTGTNTANFRNSLLANLVVNNHLFPIINLYYCCLYILFEDVLRGILNREEPVTWPLLRVEIERTPSAVA